MSQCIAIERSHPADNPSLTDAIQIHLGRELRALYGNSCQWLKPFQGYVADTLRR